MLWLGLCVNYLVGVVGTLLCNILSTMGCAQQCVTTQLIAKYDKDTLPIYTNVTLRLGVLHNVQQHNFQDFRPSKQFLRRKLT